MPFCHATRSLYEFTAAMLFFRNLAQLTEGTLDHALGLCALFAFYYSLIARYCLPATSN